jgi:hypothetical protein
MPGRMGSFGNSLKPKNGLTRISCTRHQATAACAAFTEESRMKFTNANKLHRKSGGMGYPALVAGTRFGLCPGLRLGRRPKQHFAYK